MIGGEGAADPTWMVTAQWIEYAKRYNALCFMLEHRYYGASHPTRSVKFIMLFYIPVSANGYMMGNYNVCSRTCIRGVHQSQVLVHHGN